MKAFAGLALALIWAVDATPPPPEPEPIQITRLPLPPVAPSSAVGACSLDINPRGTGCVGKTNGLQSGNFLPDGIHVLAVATFAGAPASPAAASIYDGEQVLIIKSDGTTFSSGDPWKCLTCGVSAENSAGRGSALDYPQSFLDGRRVLAGHNIIECPGSLASDCCNSKTVRIIPLRWNSTVDGSGPARDMRELRIHNDNAHIGFSSLNLVGIVGQASFTGRITYDPAPSKGEPLVPRYDVTDVYHLGNAEDSAAIVVDPEDPTLLQLRSETAHTVGELRGFGGTGREVTYIGASVESCNIDVFAADMTTGAIRRLTSHPEYVDPVDLSPDDQWTVVMDTRGTDRQMFLAGLRGVPPLTDMVTAAAVSSTRNNGQRRFFRTYLIDYYGDRGSYAGQKLGGSDVGVPGGGSFTDPEWNGRADPKWSYDGTKIVYTEVLTIAPACGGINPLPCYNSTEDGGRTERILIAHLTSRESQPLPSTFVQPVPDVIPWGTPHPPGSPFPTYKSLAPGIYTLKAKASGWANVTLEATDGGNLITRVAVEYFDYSDDGLNVLSGSESVLGKSEATGHSLLEWHSNLTVTGPNNGTKVTSPDGFYLSVNVFINDTVYNGTLVTTVNGKKYVQPASHT